MTVLTFLFYFWGFVFLVYELVNFFYADKKVAKDLILKALMQEISTAKDEDKEVHKAKIQVFMKLMKTQLRYMLWAAIGLFTVNWIWFLILWIMGYVTRKFEKAFPGFNTQIHITRADAFISALIILIIEYNHFF